MINCYQLLREGRGSSDISVGGCLYETQIACPLDLRSGGEVFIEHARVPQIL